MPLGSYSGETTSFSHIGKLVGLAFSNEVVRLEVVRVEELERVDVVRVVEVVRAEEVVMRVDVALMEEVEDFSARHVIGGTIFLLSTDSNTTSNRMNFRIPEIILKAR